MNPFEATASSDQSHNKAVPDGENGKSSLMPWPGCSIAGDHEGQVDRA